MNVLNIHGYKGTTHNAAYNTLCNLEKPIISPEIDYDNEQPEEILRRLTDLCVSENIESLVGTSLGGFFALVLSIKLEKPVILVNPCLQPEVILPELGYAGETSPFISMAAVFKKLNRDAVYCVIGDSDEVIGAHEFTKDLLGAWNIKVVSGGKHSGETLHLDRYFPDMLKYHYIYNLNMKRRFAVPKRDYRIEGDCLVECRELWEDPDITECIIPPGIKTIGRCAFYQFIYLEKITLPEGLEEIGDFAFDRCAALREINIPSSVKKIGEGVFRNCLSLYRCNVKFPEGAEICGDPFETPQSEWEELDYVLYDQRDNPLLRGDY